MMTSKEVEEEMEVKEIADTKGGATQNKYDRQLRLWHSHGQLRLLKARVCTLGSGPVATEFLKNMILPGTGSNSAKDKDDQVLKGCITIVDDAKIQKRDFGNNFFMEGGVVGQSRAQVVRKNLHELNPDDTNVVCEERNIKKLICGDNGKTFFDQFTLVVGTQLAQATALRLEEICRSRGVPLILAKVNGFIGYVRNDVPCHYVLESHDNFSRNDNRPFLHVAEPFKELKDLALESKAEIEKESNPREKLAKHNRVPWLLLQVCKVLEMKGKSHSEVKAALRKDDEDARKAHNEYVTKEYLKNLGKKSLEDKDWDVLKTHLEDKDWAVLNKKFAMLMPTNYEEAVDYVHTRFITMTLDSYVKKKRKENNAFEAWWSDSRCDPTVAAPRLPSTPFGHFWMIARTLRRFAKEYGRFPVCKALPDMESGNALYERLQRCFKEKEKSDAAAFKVLLLQEYPSRQIPSDDAIGLFCRNAHHVEVYKMSSYADELKRKFSVDDMENFADKDAWPGDFSLHPFKFYLLQRAAELFREDKGYYPGWTDATYQADLKGVVPYMQSVLKIAGLKDDYLDKEKHAMEIVRYGASEILAVAAFVGGIVAQEATKIITHQFQPLENTLLYNGLSGTAKNLKL